MTEKGYGMPLAAGDATLDAFEREICDRRREFTSDELLSGHVTITTESGVN